MTLWETHMVNTEMCFCNVRVPVCVGNAVVYRWTCVPFRGITCSNTPTHAVVLWKPIITIISIYMRLYLFTGYAKLIYSFHSASEVSVCFFFIIIQFSLCSSTAFKCELDTCSAEVHALVLSAVCFDRNLIEPLPIDSYLE